MEVEENSSESPLMFRRAIKNTQTHMWAKMGEECTGKGSEGIGPTDRTSR